MTRPTHPNWGGARRGAGAPAGPRPVTLAREQLIEHVARRFAGPAFDDLSPREKLQAAARGLAMAGEFELAAHCLRRAERLAVNRGRRPLSPPISRRP